MNSFFNNPSSSTQHAQNTLLAGNTELLGNLWIKILSFTWTCTCTCTCKIHLQFLTMLTTVQMHYWRICYKTSLKSLSLITVSTRRAQKILKKISKTRSLTFETLLSHHRLQIELGMKWFLPQRPRKQMRLMSRMRSFKQCKPNLLLNSHP